MRCIAQISDLHFGTEDPAIAAGLKEDLRSQNPSLIAVSGDLTQRGRSAQFRAAKKFLDELPQPQVVVPGNHDVPLYDVFRRFLSPLGRYRRIISNEVNPCYEDSEIILLGINTARSLTWKSGRISMGQIEQIRRTMAGGQGEKFKILMTHHPFIPPPGDPVNAIDLIGRAAIALPVLDECGVDLLLAGHLHHGYSGDVRTYYPATSRSIIVVQAGTAISRRIRTEPNGYNLLRLDRTTIEVEVRRWNGTAFVKEKRAVYRLKDKAWELQQAEEKRT
ncbi:MAG: metallophosphoesterase family protein [Limisphaerales bacterium]